MIGHKIAMSLTGIAMILFLIVHLAGNLAIFTGEDAVNTYAAFLKSMPKLLWTLRITMIVIVLTHVVTSIKLSLRNNAARPVAYANKQSVRASTASRTMMLSGLVVLSFILFHLAHLTLGWINPDQFHLIDDQGRHDVYMMTVMGFQNIYVSAFYVLAQILLAMHISHGFSSAAQTLGLTTCGCVAKFLRTFGRVFAVVMAALYISIPVSVWSGMI